MIDIVLSLVVLCAIALVCGAIYLWRRPGMRKQAVLMLVLAAVAAANVVIWAAPDDSGSAPLDRVGRSAD